MLPDISFVKGQGGLGRPLPGQDFISSLIFYVANGSLPAGFSANNRILKFYGISDAEAAGIGSTYADETQATATITVTAVGVNGNTITPQIVEPLGKVVSLGTYTKINGDGTVNAVAAGIAAAINANTQTTGYIATVLNAVVTIKARKGLGIFLNTNTPLSNVIVGTITVTTVQFAGGVASLQAVWHYHIARFFIVQPQGVLFVAFYPIPAPYTFAEIITVQQFAKGTIRQFGIFKDPASAYALGDFDTLQGIKTTLDGLKMPASMVYAADLSGTADITTVGDLSALNDNGVSDCIAQDGAALGAALFYAYGKSITALGAMLGAIALASVSQSIAWVQKFNMDDGTEFDVLAFANGQLYSSIPWNSSALATIDTQRHVFLRKFIGQSGSFWNNSHTAITPASDYAFIEDNRTIDKADRLIYINVLPFLNGPVQLNADGTISNLSISYITDLANTALDPMVRAGELSGYKVTIDPTQNLNTAGKLIIAVKLLQEGVARNIQVNIGYTNTLS